LRLPLERSLSEYCHDVWYGKNENGLAIRRWNKFEDTVTRFDRMYESDRHTYRQTDGHTDVHRMTVYAALAQHRAAKNAGRWVCSEAINLKDSPNRSHLTLLTSNRLVLLAWFSDNRNANMRFVGHIVRSRLVCLYFYRAMRMHSADYAVARCLSVRHTPVLCLNNYTYPQSFFTVG